MKPNKQLSAEAQSVKLGAYEHYKGNKYQILGVAYHSESLEELVIYQAEYGNKSLWARPLAMFLEEIEVGDKKVPRFRYLGKIL